MVLIRYGSCCCVFGKVILDFGKLQEHIAMEDSRIPIRRSELFHQPCGFSDLSAISSALGAIIKKSKH